MFAIIGVKNYSLPQSSKTSQIVPNSQLSVCVWENFRLIKVLCSCSKDIICLYTYPVDCVHLVCFATYFVVVKDKKKSCTSITRPPAPTKLSDKRFHSITKMQDDFKLILSQKTIKFEIVCFARNKKDAFYRWSIRIVALMALFYDPSHHFVEMMHRMHLANGNCLSACGA